MGKWRRSITGSAPGSSLGCPARRSPSSPAGDASTRAWRTDPAWGALLRVVSLRKLSPEDSQAFLHHKRAASRYEALRM
jgi:CxxC motif-containing protein (DUF1111 family)